jgi:hypothetical protein
MCLACSFLLTGQACLSFGAQEAERKFSNFACTSTPKGHQKVLWVFREPKNVQTLLRRLHTTKLEKPDNPALVKMSSEGGGSAEGFMLPWQGGWCSCGHREAVDAQPRRF